MLREKLKRFALRHQGLLALYRGTFGKLKTKYYFDAQKRALQKHGLSLIAKIDEALVSEGARYFADYGTLLGLIREGKLIEHDRDIDFGIYFDDEFTPERLDGIMRGLGLRRLKVYSLRGEVQEITYARGILDVDFFRHTETGNNSLAYFFHRFVEVKYPSDSHYSAHVEETIPITGIKRTSIGGIELNIPENAEEYMADVYGNSWRTPNPNWKYTMGPNHILPDEYAIRSHDLP